MQARNLFFYEKRDGPGGLPHHARLAEASNGIPLFREKPDICGVNIDLLVIGYDNLV